MRKITKAITWQDLGCTNREAANRVFTPWEANEICRFQRANRSIDKMTSGMVKQVSEIIGRDGHTLRDLLGHERRKDVNKNGSLWYLNMAQKERGRPSSNGSAKPKHGLFVAWLPTEEIRLDPKYQRALKQKWKTYRGDEWDWRACGALTVSDRGGNYWVVDGLQRLSAMLEDGRSEALCVIVKCESEEDEAELFCMCNVARTQLSSLEKYWAKWEAGQRAAKDIRIQVEKRDFCIKRPGTQQDGCVAGTINSIARIEQAYEDGILIGLLDVVAGAINENNRKHILSAFYLGGIGYLLKVADAEHDRLCKVLRKVDWEALTARAKTLNNQSKSLGLGGGGAKYFAQAMAEQYNKGCPKSKRVVVL